MTETVGAIERKLEKNGTKVAATVAPNRELSARFASRKHALCFRHIWLRLRRKRPDIMPIKGKLGDDILVFPMVAVAAPSIAKLEADDDLFVSTNLMALRKTMLGNFLAIPGVSLPMGAALSGAQVGHCFRW